MNNYGYKEGMRVRMKAIGLSPETEGSIITDGGDLFYCPDGQFGLFPIYTVRNLLTVLDDIPGSKFKIGDKVYIPAQMLSGVIIFPPGYKEPVVYLDCSDPKFPIEIYLSDLERHSNVMLLSDHLAKDKKEIDCPVCSRKNDCGYQKCWWCENEP